ncbi:Hypothetical predicted protein [Pelobates cultripes]|uniref:Hyaluronan/mRNA-binding protein domain-containing protein n=1 Tax=Pelobates cultripes TaxID=61616 RepID=A0AAD1S7N8_PELCU|nr:Hypothetical predicted protein [Pelobates cultripes]
MLAPPNVGSAIDYQSNHLGHIMSDNTEPAISQELRDWLVSTIAESIPKALAAFHEKTSAKVNTTARLPSDSEDSQPSDQETTPQMKQIHIEPAASRMEEAFGCAVENRFNRLLDDETDPLEFLQKAAEEKSRRKKKQTVAKNDGKKESQRDRKAQFAGTNTEVMFIHFMVTLQGEQSSDRWRRGSSNMDLVSQSDQYQAKVPFVKHQETVKLFGNKRYRIEQEPDERIEQRMETVDKEKLVKNWLSNRGGTRGKGRGGFSRNTEQDNQRGKREFERHSGSGRGGLRAEDKRGGSGSHNWGSIQDEYSDISLLLAEENVKKCGDTEAVREAHVVKFIRVTEELPAEELAEEMTLDEWKCMQAQNRARPDFNLRKPASSVPSKAVVIHKSKYKNNMEDEGDLQYVCRRPINDITAQLDINFGSLSRPGRGGRGGGRGRVRREEPFSHAMDDVYTIAPDPDDFEDFPALS